MSLAVPDTQVISTVGAGAFLTQMVAALQHLALATVHLFENNINPTPATLVAAFTEPGSDWAEYAAVVIAGWGAQRSNTDGSVSIMATNKMEFVGPVLGGGPTIYGYFVKSAQAGTPLLYSSRFTTPIPMTDNTRVLDLVPSFTMPNLVQL